MSTKRFIAKHGLDNNNQTITNVATPVNSTDVVIKSVSDSILNVANVGNTFVYTGGTVSGNVTVSGIMSATSFSGSGSGLTGTANSLNIGGNANTVSNGIYTTSTTASIQFGSFGVGTAASGNLGEIRAANNITAYYSDSRLKENIVVIDNALYKLSQIRGVTFNSNATAEQYGYTDKRQQVGVIAQEIQSILPQIVVPAPFDLEKDENGQEYSKSGMNYMTVQYEKLIPLLIQAIKEQQWQIDDLRSKICR